MSLISLTEVLLAQLVRTIDTLGPLSCEPPSSEPRSKVAVKVAEEGKVAGGRRPLRLAVHDEGPVMTCIPRRPVSASRVRQPLRHLDPQDEDEEEEEEEGHQGYGAEFDVPALVTGPPEPRTRSCSSPLPAAVDGATYLSPPSLQGNPSLCPSLDLYV